ncbi:MAG: hypothetical protein VCD00_18035 [Candidatus Hydrogenedentota bacterium]
MSKVPQSTRNVTAWLDWAHEVQSRGKVGSVVEHVNGVGVAENWGT